MLEWVWIGALAGGVFLGASLVWFAQRGRSGLSTREEATLRAGLSEAEQAREVLAERTRGLELRLEDSRQALQRAREENTDLHSELARSDERIRSLDAKLAEQKQDLEAVHKRLTAEFEALANRVLEANAASFATRNKESLDKLLLPLSEKIGAFRDRVEKAHDQGLKDRAALIEQLRTLGELNQRMSQEARDLTSALRGQSKTQGNWGELILETVLEKSGLVPDQEYIAQASVQGDDGKRYQPDVLIKLPEGKHLVIDAKVSLTAYERCVNADDERVRESALKEHLTSVRGHVTELGRKRYDALYGIDSPDFVLMFVPIESAFSLAMRGDDTLFDFAFRRNVAMVTPSTLLATLRTVSNIWRQDKQNRNALEIARRSGALYDKFVGFFEDMDRIGEQIKRAGEAYDGAMNKLKTGRGNLVSQTQALKELGAKAKKSLPDSATDGLTAPVAGGREHDKLAGPVNGWIEAPIDDGADR